MVNDLIEPVMDIFLNFFFYSLRLFKEFYLTNLHFSLNSNLKYLCFENDMYCFDKKDHALIVKFL